MSSIGCTAIVLAAGKGTRMCSSLPKVLHYLIDRPLIYYPVRLLQRIECTQIVVVVGHRAEEVEQYLSSFGVITVRQEEQLGTAHAVACALPVLDGSGDSFLIMCGDMPLFREDSIVMGYEYHKISRNHLTVLSTRLEDPTGYGRIVRSPSGNVVRIVEEKDASVEERMINEVNTGTFFVEGNVLFEFLSKIDNDNRQGEYYLTDLVGLVHEAGGRTGAFEIKDANEAKGVNSRIDLSKAEALLLERLRRFHMENGVTLHNPASIFIGTDVVIERDVVIEPFVVLKGRTTIKKGAIIGSFSYIEDGVIAEGRRVKPYSRIIGE